MWWIFDRRTVIRRKKHHRKGRQTVTDTNDVILTSAEIEELTGEKLPLTPDGKDFDPADGGELDVTAQEAAEDGTDNEEVAQ
jgi:hypothetical protein